MSLERSLTDKTHAGILRDPALLIPAGLFVAGTALYAMQAYRQNANHWMFLDDAFIHMAMAKNILQHGVFGVTAHEFSSASSSPLWTLLLALMFNLFGVNEIVPFLLNVVFGICCIVLVYLLCRQNSLPRAHTFLILIAFVFFASIIPIVVFTAMEHTLHILAILVSVILYINSIQQEDSPRWRVHSRWLAVTIAIGAAVRYETIFFAVSLALLLFTERRYVFASSLLLAALLPSFLYGAYSVAHGGLWLPNSFYVKGVLPQFETIRDAMQSLGLRSLDALFSPRYLFLFVLVIGALITLLVNGTERAFTDRRQHLLIVFVLTSLGFMQFAKVYQFYRYEAFLVALGVVGIGISWDKAAPMRRLASFRSGHLAVPFVVLAMFIALSRPLYGRALASLSEIVGATGDTYKQQFQIARFVRAHYQGRVVALNDIGAVNFFAEIQCVDLEGIGCNEVMKAKESRTYTTETIRAICSKRNVEIAVLYPSWYKGTKTIPESWECVGRWVIRDLVVSGGDTVGFYAAAPGVAAYLAQSLRTFSRELPPNVQEMGLYLDEK